MSTLAAKNGPWLTRIILWLVSQLFCVKKEKQNYWLYVKASFIVIIGLT
ncbi:Hypothetical protein AKI40_4207 [Enterobacter sp. FY-07]|nr:Hypothetical protein AKI40_4207 [Enterobacter sp. FY-07]